MSAYPAPPWRLEGRVLLIPAMWPPRNGLERRRRRPSLGGIMVADHAERSTLAYGELLAARVTVRLGLRIGWLIDEAYVDDTRAVAAGLDVWSLPKELACFRWSPDGWDVQLRTGGRVLLDVRATRPRLRWPQPMLAPFVGRSGGRTAFSLARGMIFGGPVRLRAAAPEDSNLLPQGARLLGIGFAGRHRMVVPRPSFEDRF